MRPKSTRKRGKKRKQALSAPVSLTSAELKDLLTAAKAASTRDWLMLLVGYWHGLRVSELVGLEPGHIRDGYLTVQRLKGSLKTRQELVSHSDPLLDESTALPLYMRSLRSSQKLWPISRRQADRLIKRYGTTAGIAAHKLHMHALKHTRGMHWISPTGIEHTRQALGHSSIRSTQIYARVTDEQADTALKRAVLGQQ